MDDFSGLAAIPPDRITPIRGAVHTRDEARHSSTRWASACFTPRVAELPNLRDATAGDRGTSEGLNWQWKDELASEHVVYYGRPFRRKPGFVTIPLLSALYGVAAIADYGGDPHELARAGMLSAEACRIAETIQEKGSLSTRGLRQESGLSASRDNTRFARALEEAQEKLLVAMIRTTSTSRAGYGYVWDTFARAWPDAVAAGERLRPQDAAAALIARYVDTTGAATAAMIARIFSLEDELVEKAGAALVAQGTVHQVTRGAARYWVCPVLH
jgi:hypothetical protein